MSVISVAQRLGNVGEFVGAIGVIVIRLNRSSRAVLQAPFTGRG
jgi:hypothetical protein